MQKSYLMKLYELAEKDSNVLLLLADSGSGFEALFHNYLPNQILDFGIAEENMVVSAAGMASCGKIPFVFTAGAFLAYRSMEFIRDDICLQNHNVKIIGMGSGLGWSTLGPTHHTTEDLGILRSMPNLIVLSPSTPKCASECIRLAYEINGPVYIRLGMGGEKEYYDDNLALSLKNNILAKEGNDITIFSYGDILGTVLEVANMLEENHISTKVIDIFSINPLDINSIINEAKAKSTIISVEEHSIIGGLGSAISEIIADNNINVNYLRIGLNREFAKGYGTHEEVKAQNGLDAKSIYSRIVEFMVKYD